MVPFARRLLSVVALLSLVLCLGTLVAWRQSYRRYGSPEVWGGGRLVGVGWSAGEMFSYTYALPGERVPPAGYHLVQHPPTDLERQLRSSRTDIPVSVHSVIGFGCYRTIGDRRLWGAFAPAWFVALATAVFPAWWLPREYRRLRVARCRRAGRCPRCEYDLRASPERCPECGIDVARGVPLTSPTSASPPAHRSSAAS